MGHGLVGFVLFSWLFLLFVTGLTVFTGGFLLKRSVVTQNSSCVHNFSGDFSSLAAGSSPSSSSASGCWIPSRFNKSLIILIDGLRYDFAVQSSNASAFYNKIPIFSDLLAQKPKHSSLFKFIADPPTTTMQRIKGILTGSLPTFIDASDNFASFEIQEDNLIDHLVSLRKKVVFMGDDTWTGLLPRRFHRSYPFPSFNVKDLDTVDDGILVNLVPLIRNSSEWDVIVAHFLGVDHCGHTYGPNHPQMTRKLNQMNDMIKSVIESLDEETVLFVFGDHGMTKTGDHGGDSSDETDSALFVYSAGQPLSNQGALVKTEVNQIDFASTFSLLLGLPIPFGNLGTITSEFFDVPISTRNDAKALYLNAKQVELYLRTYSSISEDFTSRSAATDGLRVLINEIDVLWKKEFASNVTVETLNSILLKKKCVQYLSEVQTLCRETWAKFDLVSIVFGLVITLFALISTFIVIAHRVAVSSIAAFVHLGLGLIGTLLALHSWLFPVLRWLQGFESSLLFFIVTIQVIGSCFLLTAATVRNFWEMLHNNAAAVVIVFVLFCLFFSNSYVVSEDTVTTFLATTLLWYNILSQRQKSNNEKKRKAKTEWSMLRNVVATFIATIVVSTCIRFASVSWKCREEQWWCEGSPFLEPKMSSIPSDKRENIAQKNMRLLLSLASLGIIVFATRWLLRKAGNLNGFSPAVLCAAYCPGIMGLGIALYWAMQGASLLAIPNFVTIIPNAVFLVGAFGIFVLLVQPLCIYDAMEPSSELGSLRWSGDKELLVPQVYRHLRANWEKHLHSAASSVKGSNEKPLIVYGLATVFSAAQLVVVTIVVLLLVLLSRDGYAVSYALFVVVIGAVLHSYSLGKTNQMRSGKSSNIWDVPWSWVVLWSLLSSVGFYATGHQQTFPTIHWDAAVVGSDGNFTSHTIPALKVLFNTFSSTIIVGVFLPSFLLWPTSRQVVFKSKETSTEFETGEFLLLDNTDLFFDGLCRLSCQYLAVNGIKLFGCMSAAALHRRHLMVWKIFAPRFVFEALNFVMFFPAVLFCYLIIYSVYRALQRWFNEQEKKKGRKS